VSGEHTACHDNPVTDTGSSPRERGARLIDDYPRPEDSDHPRVSGEHTACHDNPVTDTGSSPRERGALD